jgi:hypothetical protein
MTAEKPQPGEDGVHSLLVPQPESVIVGSSVAEPLALIPVVSVHAEPEVLVPIAHGFAAISTFVLVLLAAIM